MANKVEFQLNSDTAKAIADAQKLVDKVAEVQQKYDEAGKTARNSNRQNKEGLDSVVGSIGSIASALGIAGGAGAAFQQVLQQIQEQAAAINREAQKSLEVGRQTSASFGSFVSNNPGITEGELNTYRTGLTNALQAFPQQGEGAEAMGISALEQTISAGTALSPEQRVAAVREALQVRSVNPNANLSGTAGGIAALMQNFGFDENQASNFIIGTQQQSRVANFEGVATGLARISPAVQTSGIDPLQAAGLFAFGTTTLQDASGEQTATNISNMLTRLTTRRDKISEKSGLNLQGNAMENLMQIVEARRSGMLDNRTFSEVLPMIAEGQGQNLILSMIADGGAGLARTTSAIGSNDIMGGDALGGQQAILANNPTFRMAGALRGIQTRADQVRSGDLAGQESATVRNAMIAQLELEGLSESGLNAAGSTFDAYIQAGFDPASAFQRGRRFGRVRDVPLLGGLLANSTSSTYNAQMDAIDYPEGSLPGAASSTEELLKTIAQEMESAVSKGMSAAMRENQQAQPMTGADL